MNKISSNQFVVGDFVKVTKIVGDQIHKLKTVIILPCSLHDLAQAQKNHFYNQVDIYLTDGMPLVWYLSIKNKKPIDRIYGPNLMKFILKKNKNKNPISVFLGANQNTLSRLRKIIPKKPGNSFLLLKKSDTAKKEQQILDQIIKVQPNILWIGIGSPKQVELAARLKPKLKNTTIFCVGAAFDFIGGIKKQAPRWIQRSGLEWLFRLITEPLRLSERYLVIIPKYILSIIIKKIFRKI